MKIGYARVSTEDQSLDLQIDALKQAGCETIYQEKISGKSVARPELEACLKALRTDDTLMVWSLDRLGRSVSNLIEIVNSLGKKGICFESIKQNIETRSAGGQLVFHIFASLAEYERSQIKERTLAGLQAARKRGRTGGRPFKMTKDDIIQAATLMDNPNIPISEIMKRFKVGKTTLYRNVNAYRETQKKGKA